MAASVRTVISIELVLTARIRIVQWLRVYARHHLVVRILFGARHDLNTQVACQLPCVAGVDTLLGRIGAGVVECHTAINEGARILQNNVVTVQNVRTVLVEQSNVV